MGATTVDRAEAEQVRHWSCERKMTFDGPGHARAAAYGATEEYGKPMAHYACCFCDGWHVGSAPITMGQLRRIATAIRVLSGSLEPSK